MLLRHRGEHAARAIVSPARLRSSASHDTVAKAYRLCYQNTTRRHFRVARAFIVVLVSTLAAGRPLFRHAEIFLAMPPPPGIDSLKRLTITMTPRPDASGTHKSGCRDIVYFTPPKSFSFARSLLLRASDAAIRFIFRPAWTPLSQLAGRHAPRSLPVMLDAATIFR